jgi:hypothetical protein
MRRSMSGSQRAEVLSGLAACLVGLLALGVVLFAPLASYASSTTTPDGSTWTFVRRTESLVQSGIQSETWFYLAILVVCLMMVAVSAALHSRSGKGFWRVPLWVATMLILAFVILASPSIGLFLAPAGLLALVAACLSLGTGPAVAAQE